MKKQGDAVFSAVCNVLGTSEFTQAVTLTSEQKSAVSDQLVAGFMAGEISMSDEAKAKYTDESTLKKYVSGLINNWVRKDKRLNGGSAYVPKNPGVRSSGSPELKALKQLLALCTTPEQQQKVQAEITMLEAKLAAEKATKTVTTKINAEHIPEHLRHLLSVG